MRWFFKKERIKTFFAFLPITINNETRWLEKVVVKQEFIEDCVSPIGEYFCSYWNNVKFLN
jgi:hypothetical protein